MITRSSAIRKSVAVLAALPLAATGVVLMAPAASASHNTTTTVNCHTDKKGHDLDVRITITHDDEDIDRVKVRATDNEEDGSFDDNKVHLQNIRVRYVDDDGDTIGESNENDSPFTISEDVDYVHKIKVKVTWTVKGSTKTKDCNSHSLD